MFVAAKLGTILVPSGPGNDPGRKHLFVVLTDPYGPAKQVLLAPVCSVIKDVKPDDSCLLGAADHEFLQHDSYIDYAKIRIERADTLEHGVTSGAIVEKPPVSAAVYARVLAGMGKSKFAKPFAKDFLADSQKPNKPTKAGGAAP